MGLRNVDISVDIKINGMDVTIDVEVDPEKVLDLIDVSDVVEYLDADIVLDEIGEGKVIEYFSIEVAE